MNGQAEYLAAGCVDKAQPLVEYEPSEPPAQSQQDGYGKGGSGRVRAIPQPPCRPTRAPSRGPRPDGRDRRASANPSQDRRSGQRQDRAKALGRSPVITFDPQVKTLVTTVAKRTTPIPRTGQRKGDGSRSRSTLRSMTVCTITTEAVAIARANLSANLKRSVVRCCVTRRYQVCATGLAH